MRFGGDWRSRLARWFGRPLGAAATAGRSPARPNGMMDERNAASPVPTDWLEFAGRLQERIQSRVNSGDETAAGLQMSLQSRAGEAGPPPTIALRVWVSPDGFLEFVEAEGMQGNLNRRGLTVAFGGEAEVGPVPAGMPQPLRMRLTVAEKPPEPAV